MKPQNCACTRVTGANRPEVPGAQAIGSQEAIYVLFQSILFSQSRFRAPPARSMEYAKALTT
jgi:hypothetical protein